jgi:serine protease Do
MAASRFFSVSAGMAGAGLLLTPALAALVDTSSPTAVARDLTEEQQQSGAVPPPSLAPLAQRVSPAVVNISVELNQQTALQDQRGEARGSGDSGPAPQPGGTPFDPFLRRFSKVRFRRRAPRRHVLDLGSAFIIDPPGYVVTNNHVADNAEKITVIFQDQSQHAAKVVGRNDNTNLGVLKIA